MTVYVPPLQSTGGLHGGYWYAGTPAHGYPIAGAGKGSGWAIAQLARAERAFGAEPEPLENAGIRAGEIEAWRCFRVRNRGAWLQSMVVETIWMPGESIKSETSPTDFGCAGIHAWKTANEAIAYGIGYGGYIVAVGRVNLWGEVVEHTNGYRAEYARIVSIEYVLNKKWRASALRRRLAATYCSNTIAEAG